MLIQMLPTVFELIADESDPVEIRSHGKAFVFLLDFLVAGAFLRQGLVIQS